MTLGARDQRSEPAERLMRGAALFEVYKQDFGALIKRSITVINTRENRITDHSSESTVNETVTD